jgi:hypothetical protein
MGKLAALVESDKPSPETVLWLINKARTALGLRRLAEVPKGVVPSLHEYEAPSSDACAEAWEEYDDEPYEKALARLPHLGGVYDFGEAGVRMAWLDRGPRPQVHSPLGVALHCEPEMGVDEGFRFLCVPRAAGESLAKVLDTRLLPAMRDNDGGVAFVLLPKELYQFIECYEAALYPELTNPSPLELRLYELQTELDMRDFADKFGRVHFWRIAAGVALILLALYLTRVLLC